MAGRKRADGEASRQRILDAARDIARERGYEGTSIGLVSKRCGLPASSIYWHFTDKDDLIAAVIRDSFGDWTQTWSAAADTGAVDDRVLAAARQAAAVLAESPDFMRLGLMLALERRPVEPRARAMFLEIRETAREAVRNSLAQTFPALDATAIDRLTTYSMACSDGLFLAREIDGDAVDLAALFELHAQAITALAQDAERQVPA